MIEKNKLDAVFEEPCKISEVEDQTEIPGDSELIVVVCDNCHENDYSELKNMHNALICNNMDYLNSVNHLNDVQKIIVDYDSFANVQEVAFIIRTYLLLHRHADIIVKAAVYTNEMNVIQQDIDVSRVFFTDDLMHGLNTDCLIPIGKMEPVKKESKRKIINPLVLKSTGFFIIALLCYLVIFIPENKEIVHNQNMNVQLDMGNTMLLPIEKVFCDQAGCHIVIEEVTKDEAKININLYDHNKNKITVDIQEVKCQNDKCNTRYELVFRYSSDIDYYILQLEKDGLVKRVEIDNLYFER